MLSLRSLTAAAAVLLLLVALTMGDSEDHKLNADLEEHLADLQTGSEEQDSSMEDKIKDKSLHSHDSDEHPVFPVHRLHFHWHPPKVMNPPLASLFAMSPAGVPVFRSPSTLSSLPLANHPFGGYIPVQALASHAYPFLPPGPGFGGVVPASFAPFPYYAHHQHRLHHQAYHYPLAAAVADPHRFPVLGDVRPYMASVAATQNYQHYLFEHDHDHSHDDDHDLSDSHDEDDHAHGPHYHVHAHGPHFHAHAHYPNNLAYAYGPHFHAHGYNPNYAGYAYGPHFHAHGHYPSYAGYAYGPNFHVHGHYPNYAGYAYGPHFHAHGHYPSYAGYAYGPHFHAQAPYPNYPGYAYGPSSHTYGQYPNYPAYAYGSHVHAYTHDSDNGAYAYGLHFPAYGYDPDNDATYAYGHHLDAYPYAPMSAYPYGLAHHGHDVHVDWPMQYAHMWPLHPDHYDSYQKLYWNQDGQCSWESPMPCWGLYTCVSLSSLCDGRFDCANDMDEDPRLCITGKRPNMQVMTYFFSLPDQAWMIKKLFNNRDPVYIAMAMKFAVNLEDLKWALSLDEEAVNNTRAVFQAVKDDNSVVPITLDMKEDNWSVTKLFFRRILDAGFNISKD